MKKIFLVAILLGYCSNNFNFSQNPNFKEMCMYSFAGGWYGGAFGATMYLLSGGRKYGNSYEQALWSHALASAFAIALIYRYQMEDIKNKKTC